MLARPLAPSTTRPSPGKMSPRTPSACSVYSPSARMKKSTSSTSASIPRRRRSCEFSPRPPRRPARRATDPRRRRELWGGTIQGLEFNNLGSIPPEIGQLTALTSLRVPPASPTPGAARDRPSASQEPLLQQDHWHDPARDRPAHGADVPASSPRVPDARRAARPPLGVAGTSQAATTRSPARSRPSFAASQLARPTLATTSSRRAARATVAICSALRVSRSLTSPTIP